MKIKTRGRPKAGVDRVQKTHRFPKQLDREFGRYLKETGGNENAVLQTLVADLLERRYGSSIDATQLDSLLRYWECLPAAVAIKEVRGRVIFGNPEFRRVIGCQDVTGALPTDYFHDDPDVASRVMAHDRAAVEHQKPIISVDVIPVAGERRERLAIRFPIFDRAHQRVEMTGSIGFDLEHIVEIASSLQPRGFGVFEHRKNYKEDNSAHPPVPASTLPASILKAFIYNLPAILTVKGFDDKLLCVNAEYTRVFGRPRSEVLGRRPTENWPGEVGEWIEARDREVREQGVPIISIENIPSGKESHERVTIRFPIRGSSETADVIDYIGTIGFDYGVIKKGIELLRDKSGRSRVYAFLLSGDPESLQGFPIAV